jgi:hypothetical protein
MVTLLLEKKRHMVQHEESPGFFLVLDYADDMPEFTSDVEIASKYLSEDIAGAAIDRVRLKGFTMGLRTVPVQIIFNVGV